MSIHWLFTNFAIRCLQNVATAIVFQRHIYKSQEDIREGAIVFKIIVFDQMNKLIAKRELNV